ncbi:adenine glycosylase [Vibrio parahaemolyticus]|uniref:baseplate complex protein n=1 Tax=Vibrio parahaemolyticus TaxID=670 RepID=UPI000C87A41C|nr:adenine glycosylase [Vibrio parahaemolyticus]PMT73896.1 adenine glycosylase [Vibrio parahaemolyticus]PMT79096.1 adenine glycosylase [Vibrio parahaemolyticus]
MTLQLNNQEINGKEIRINIKLPFGDSDLSGTGSGTDSAEEGTKAKEMTVNLLVPFEHSEWLTDLVELAEATDENGARTVYRIGNDAAKAMKFYQAKFTGELNIAEQDQTMAWRVNFTLTEKLSVPERKQQREPIKAAAQQTQGENTNEVIESDSIPPNTQLTDFERILQYTDDALGGFWDDDEETNETE